MFRECVELKSVGRKSVEATAELRSQTAKTGGLNVGLKTATSRLLCD